MTRLTRRNLLMTAATSGVAIATLGIESSAIAAQDGDKPSVTVGSKNLTEVIILGHMMTQLLEDAGYPTDTQFNLGGTVVLHEGAVGGDIDVYAAYTGTALVTILGHDLSDVKDAIEESPATPVGSETGDPVARKTYEIVSREYSEQFGFEWLKPFGFNATYVLAIDPDIAEKHDLKTISDLQGVAEDLVIGCSQEFLARPDGLPNLEKEYGIDFKEAIGFEPNLVYAAIEEGQVDIIAGGATEGHIGRLGLVTLEDDLGYFPPYYAAPVVRQNLLNESPEIRDVLNQLGGRIDGDTMGDLTLESDQDGRNPKDIARDFLIDQELIEG